MYFLSQIKLSPAEQKVYDLVGQTRGSDAQEIVENRGRFQLQRLHDIHLHSDFPHELQPNGHIEHVYIAVAVAALVLLIACINYVNLAIARGVRRAREIGIRKAIGAHRHQLVTQLLGESALTCLFALALAVGIAQLTLPSFNAFIDKNTSLLASSDLLLLAAGAAVVVGLIAGLYPAFVISARPPALALALFTSELRTREFAVRKVLGASDRQIASLLLISFTWPVLAALCAAWPAAYFAVRTWLESFTYRTAIDPFIFVASASAVLAVVWTTVGYQALRAARANPVDALRSE